VATNIGVHFFDLLIWLFGDAGQCRVHHSDKSRMAGSIELKHARVRWFLSVDTGDLPHEARDAGKTTFRSITIDGSEIEFTEGFTDLHTRVYEEVLAGRGFGIADARPSIELVHRIRTAPLSAHDDTTHEFVKGRV
jgi:UDP-N-acetyl-2-amino-2-deoxyglucuronate dehydrogenase